MTAIDPTPPSPFVRAARPRGIARWAPGLALLRSYRRAWLANDIAAGVVLTAVLVPVGMGYPEAARLPAITGLAATIALLIRIGLLVGGLTVIAAFFGILMNFTFLYADSVSSNPTFIVLAVLIILGWRVAGWWG